MEEWYIENTWKCDTCGQANKGRYMDCQNCGKRREEGIQDELPPDLEAAPQIVDEEQLKQARAGAHWSCPYCGGQERDLLGRCQNCGADKENTKGQADTATKSDPADAHRIKTVKCDGHQITKRASHVDDEVYIRYERKRLLFILSCIGLISILAGLSLWWLFAPREVNAVIVATSWERTLRLQERRTEVGVGWRSSMPSSAFGAACTYTFKETYDCNSYRCNPHQESYSCRPHSCNCSVSCTSQKNGYSKCRRSCSTCYSTCYRTVYSTCYHKCDRYEDWCLYSYYTWPTIKAEKKSGSDHPVWPILKAKNKLQRVRKSESYSVEFKNRKDKWTYEPRNDSEFSAFKRHQRWLIRVNRAGSVKPLRKVSRK